MSMQENVVSFEPPRSAVIRSDRLIGMILAEEGKLTEGQLGHILDLQREVGIRFGEAAVQLGLISNDDVPYPLANHYDFPPLFPHLDADNATPPPPQLGAPF